MKKIFILIGSLTAGGAQRVAIEIANNLSDGGYDTTIITIMSKDHDFYKVPSNINRIALNLIGQNKGINKLLGNIHLVNVIRSLLKREKPDILIGMMTTNAVLSIISSIGLPIRTIASERNNPRHKHINLVWRALRKIVYRYADHHVVQSKSIAKWIENHTNSEIINIIPNSVRWPLQTFNPIVKTDEYLQIEDRIVLAVGTKIHQKGFDLLIEAFANRSIVASNWKLVIVGISETSNEGQSLYKIAEDFGIRDRLILPGRVGNVGDWYDRADIFVLSSRYEGMPNVLLEAMASGCTSISFDCKTGPGEIISHSRNGILVPPENVKILGDEIESLINKPDYRLQLSNEAIKVREKYSIERVSTMWRDVIESD